MRAVNTERRELLADAAIRVLTGGGMKALTHRAVDAEAAVPDGTASRYFRTREALLQGMVYRARDRRLASVRELTPPAGMRLDRTQLVETIVAMIRDTIVLDGEHQQAIAILHLESIHRPDLGAELEAVVRVLLGKVRELGRSGGIELTDADLLVLLSFFNGVVFTMLTLPRLAGEPDERIATIEATVRRGVDAILSKYFEPAP